MRGMDILSEEGIRVKILSLPRGKDPDDVIRLKELTTLKTVD